MLDFKEKDVHEITETAEEIEGKEASKKAAAVQKATDEAEVKAAKNEKEKKEVIKAQEARKAEAEGEEEAKKPAKEDPKAMADAKPV